MEVKNFSYDIFLLLKCVLAQQFTTSTSLGFAARGGF